MKYLLLFLFAFSFSLGFSRFVPHCSRYNYQIIQPFEVGYHYQLMKLGDEALRKHDIKYWAWGGTLVGSVRSEGFIPWDFDTDICIMEEDREKFLAIEPDLKKYDGYIVQIGDFLYRIKRRFNGVDFWGHLDVFLMRRDDEKVFCPGMYPNHFFYLQEIENLIRVQFGPILINAPSIYIPYLKRGYGPDVLNKAEIMYTNNPKTKKPYPKFTIFNFSPAIFKQIDYSIPLNDTPLF